MAFAFGEIKKPPAVLQDFLQVVFAVGNLIPEILARIIRKHSDYYYHLCWSPFYLIDR
jgi:hypothetical protein